MRITMPQKHLYKRRAKPYDRAHEVAYAWSRHRGEIARWEEGVAMTPDRRRIQQCLKAFDFKTLFIEELGWDTLREAPLALTVDGQSYMLHPLVEKRASKCMCAARMRMGGYTQVPRCIRSRAN